MTLTEIHTRNYTAKWKKGSLFLMKREDLSVGDVVLVNLSKWGIKKLVKGTIVGFVDGQIRCTDGHSFRAEFDEVVCIVQPSPEIK
jgi:hypothetical protein